MYYKLVNKECVPCDLYEWARLMENGESRRVAEDEVGEYRVSTVFLGLDHSFNEGTPMLFETMVFSGVGTSAEADVDRYFTWEEAEEGHKKMIHKWAKVRIKDD